MPRSRPTNQNAAPARGCARRFDAYIRSPFLTNQHRSNMIQRNNTSLAALSSAVSLREQERRRSFEVRGLMQSRAISKPSPGRVPRPGRIRDFRPPRLRGHGEPPRARGPARVVARRPPRPGVEVGLREESAPWGAPARAPLPPPLRFTPAPVRQPRSYHSAAW